MSLATKFGAGNAAELTAPSRNDFSRAGEGTIAPRALSYHFGSGFVSLTAPTLTWTSAETDATPEFLIDGDFQADDIIHLYRDGSPVTTHTVTAGELAAGSVSLALTAWANGIYSVTATIERNGVESGPSDPETVTINVSNATAFKATQVFGSAPTLSNSNRTAAFTGANTTIATVAAITGKKVIAFTRDAMSAVNMGFGITAIVGNAACLGFDGQRSVVWLQNGEVYLNSVKLGTVVTSGVGGTVALVVDVPSNKAWMTKDGVNFYGSSATPVTLADVEAGIGAVSITGPTATNGRSVYAATGSVFGGAAATYQATIINGYPWAMPSGYGLLE